MQSAAGGIEHLASAATQAAGVGNDALAEVRQIGCRSDGADDQGQRDVRLQVEPHVMCDAITRAETGHRLQVARCLRQIVGAEEHPSDGHNEDDVEVAEFGPDALKRCAEPGSFQNEKKAVIEAPDDERPFRAVPQPAQQEDDHQIEIRPVRAGSASAERDIEIVPEPGGQRDVPAAPEFGDRLGDVGIVEIERKIDADHQAEADRHIRVAGKVEIDLQRVADVSEPGQRGIEISAGIL